MPRVNNSLTIIEVKKKTIIPIKLCKLAFETLPILHGAIPVFVARWLLVINYIQHTLNTIAITIVATCRFQLS